MTFLAALEECNKNPIHCVMVLKGRLYPIGMYVDDSYRVIQWPAIWTVGAYAALDWEVEHAKV